MLSVIFDPLMVALPSATVTPPPYNGGVGICEEVVRKTAGVNGSHNNVQQQYPAHKIAIYISERIDGKGGGKPYMAQVGSANIDAVQPTLGAICDFIKECEID